MDFTSILTTLLENFGWFGVVVVAILVIFIVAIPVGLPIFLNKLLNKNSKDITTGVTEGMTNIANNLTTNINNQNKELVSTLKESQCKLLDTQTAMIGYIMSNIGTLIQKETSTQAETHKRGINQRAQIDAQINKILHDMLLSYMADRTAIFEFHNNNCNLGGLPFLWYDIHYEQIAKDVPMLFNKIQNMPSSNLSEIIRRLQDGTDKMCVLNSTDIESLQHNSTVLYYQLKELNVKYIIYAPIYDSSNIMVGLCIIEYSNYILGDDLFDEFIKRKEVDIHNNVARIAGLLDFKNRVEQ